MGTEDEGISGGMLLCAFVFVFVLVDILTQDR
jgi:hypothetical protein